jgi:hypothetical protein
MSNNRRSLYWWIFSFVFTILIAYYQRTTGPTYPVRGKINIDGKEIRYKLLTSNDSGKPAEICLKGNVDGMTGFIEYKKYNTGEAMQSTELVMKENMLCGELPSQPPAGKLIYTVTVNYQDHDYNLSEKPIVIRFKGAVPAFILFPHILLMFLAMLYSTRTGIEALLKREKAFSYSLITMILLFFGGMILGPVVQKYAFGALWTGWPFGHDLTDNKTLVAFLAWIIAWLRLRKNKTNRAWAIAAAVILLLVYLIPHSMFGSELDYSTGQIETGQ